MKTCHECGTKIDTENVVWYGISRDGKRHCCLFCRCRIITLSAFFSESLEHWVGEAVIQTGDLIDNVTVSCRGNDKFYVLGKAEEFAKKISPDLNAYLEIG